jgi:protoporphyrinogen oxidase
MSVVGESRADLVVLGAGPAGLGAAWRAARAGLRVVVLERARHPGGMAASFEVDGVRVDHGSHRLHPSIDPRILADLRGLPGVELQRRRRNGRIRLEGRWLRFPLDPFDLLAHLPPRFALAAARDAVGAPLRRAARRASSADGPPTGGTVGGADAGTFASVLRAGLGPAMCDWFYFPYARKLWGLEPDQLDAEQARRRVSAASPGKLLARVARGIRPGGAHFWYPRRGFGSLVEGLAEASVAAGADLRLGSAVGKVELAPDGATVTVADGTVVAARRVWSTLPLPLLAGMTEPAAPAGALAAAGRLEFRAMVLVYVSVAGGRYTRFDAHYLPDSAIPVSRLSEPANYRDGDDPDDRSVLCAEIPCAKGDALWSADEGTLAGIVLDALAASGLPRPPVRTVEVRRLPHVYPIYRAGYGRDLAALDAWAAQQPALLTLGRQGLFVHDNTHHALAMAWEAADALGRDGDWDAEAWAGARARFATHVVED